MTSENRLKSAQQELQQARVSFYRIAFLSVCVH